MRPFIAHSLDRVDELLMWLANGVFSLARHIHPVDRHGRKWTASEPG